MAQQRRRRRTPKKQHLQCLTDNVLKPNHATGVQRFIHGSYRLLRHCHYRDHRKRRRAHSICRSILFANYFTALGQARCGLSMCP